MFWAGDKSMFWAGDKSMFLSGGTHPTHIILYKVLSCGSLFKLVSITFNESL